MIEELVFLIIACLIEKNEIKQAMSEINQLFYLKHLKNKNSLTFEKFS